MAKKEKGRIFLQAWSFAVIAAALVTVGFVLADSAYRDIGVGLLSVAVAAFIIDFMILMVFRRRTVASGIVKFTALLIVNGILFTSAGFYWFAPVAIFHPNADEAAEAELAAVPQVSGIESENGLCGWRYSCGVSDAPVILCFYGNGETASRKISDFCEYIRQGYFAGFDIAVFDYPGYGHQPGRPTEESVKQAALAAYDLIRQNSNTVCVMGYSVGTGAANYVAANRDAAALALMAPYADGYDLLNNVLPVFDHALLRRLVSFKMESAVFAEKVKVTPLILASANDGTVPYSSSLRLSECYENAIFRPVDVADHNSFWKSEECLRLVSDYFKEAVS